MRVNTSKLILSCVLATGARAQYITTVVAGGGPPDGSPARSVAISRGDHLAVDSGGNVFTTDSLQNRAYKISSAGKIATLAGTGVGGYSGDQGPANMAQLSAPNGVAVDSSGNVYIGDSAVLYTDSGSNFRLRRVTPAGVIDTVAGTGVFGYSGDGGPATGATIGRISAVAVDNSGNVYIADESRIRRIAAGIITTVVGTGTPGYSGDGGPAVAAQISSVNGIATDASGNIYISDTGNCRIREVSGGIISTIAGTGACGYSGDGSAASAQINAQGLAADGAGNIYVAEGPRVRRISGGTITTIAGTGVPGYSGDGGPATSAQLASATDVGVDTGGNVYIADSSFVLFAGGGTIVRKISGGLISTIAGNRTYKFSGDGGPATSAQVDPNAIARTASGDVYISDLYDVRIRRVSGGFVTTIAGNGTPGNAGDGGPATSAQISNQVADMAADSAGNLFFIDANRIREVSGGIISTVAGNGTFGFSGDGGPAVNASLSSPSGISIDSQDAIYISDRDRIRRIVGGIINTIAGGSPAPGSVATDVSITPNAAATDFSGNVYIADSSFGQIYRMALNGTVTIIAGTGQWGFSGDNGPAIYAQLANPNSLAVDSDGDLYISDSGNCRIRKIAGGIISTVAGNGACSYAGDGGPAVNAGLSPNSIAVDTSGNLYVADGANFRIRKIAAGEITTVVGTGTRGFFGEGSPATNAQIGYGCGVAVDVSGNLYVADPENSRVRKVTGGVINTVAGNGTRGHSGDGGAATNAQLGYADSVVVDGSGNIYIGDEYLVRKVSAGVITTVAGSGSWGYSGDGGPATSAQIGYGPRVSLGPAGILLIADPSNYRLRKITGGIISTIAGNGYQSYSGDGGPSSAAQLQPMGLAADNSGNLYIADAGSARVRVIAPNGIISTVAGGGTASPVDGAAAIQVRLSYPTAVAVGDGSLYIADRGAKQLYRVVSGTITTITTVSGFGSFGFSGGGGVAVDSGGRILISDRTDSRVRLLSPGAASVTATITSGPPGVSVTIAGGGCTPGAYTTPATLPWVPQAICSITFENPHAVNGLPYQFQSSTVNGTAYSQQNPLIVNAGTSNLTINATYSNVVGTPTHFSVIAPPTATAGVPIQFTVMALDNAGNTVQTYSSPVHFTTTDPAGVVPPDTKLVNGFGTFSASLVTPGATWLSASLLLSPGISGTSNGIVVSPSTAGLRFIPIAPCRVVDTRDRTKPPGYGPPYVSGGSGGIRSYTIPSGPCPVPTAAQAYSLNVGVVPKGPLGYLTMWPTGQSQPTASTLNSIDGRIKSSAAIVPAGTGGSISVFASNPTELVIDIAGYFIAASDPDALGFFPMPPCRLVDTRPNAASTISTGILPGGLSRTLPILSSACNVPAAARAYSLNFTAVPPGPLGYLTVYPTGTTLPVVATLNALTGAVTANAAIVPAGTAGSIDVYPSNATHLVVDIDGYFAPVAPGALSLYTVPPCRVLDTRLADGALPFTGTMDINVIGSGCGGTPDAKAYVLNATVVPNGPLGYLTMWPQGSAQPIVSTLNAIDGFITNNLAIVPTTTTFVSTFASNPTHLVLDISGYFAQ